MSFDPGLSIEALEGDVWPDPPESSTGLVKSVHDLRRRPVGSLSAWDLGRLIGQGVGLPWTLQCALGILKNEASEQEAGGFFEDDLLTAVLTRPSVTWLEFPELAGQVESVLGMLTDLSPYVRREVDRFRAGLSDLR